MAYYNRRKLLELTLESIARSEYKDYEIIVVDDASTERIDDLPVRVVRVEPKDKWYHNACMPLNMGIREAKGDVVLIQNPECVHVHDVLTYVDKYICSDNYISMSCYSMDENMTKYLKGCMTPDYDSFLEWFKTLPQQSVNNYIGWYNHSVYRPVHFNFCCAITKKNLNILGGFDERYANGTGYEDDDFIDRIKRLGLKLIIADDISVIHQWHPKVYDINNPIHAAMFKKNGRLHQQTKRESIIHVND
jgi:GT2 family glycosyltransferase